MNSYYIVSIKGKNINNFLHKCNQNNINILRIKNISNKEILITINTYDINKLFKIKSIYKIKIMNSKGALKLKEILNRNLILIIFFFLGIIFLSVLSNTIFNVQIIGDNKELNKKIEKILNQNGIRNYQFKKSYKELNEIKNNIMEEFKNEIEWIEITNIGTKVEVKIVERKLPVKNTSKEYTNIIAGKSGVVRKIYAEEGEKQVLLNTYVNKGDIIISGEITKEEDVKKYVHAKGKVYAEVWYNVTIEFPLKYKEKIYTKNKCKRLYMKLSDKYISLSKYKTFERKKLHSLNNKRIPFEIGIEEEREVKIINDKYSINEAKIKAIEKAKEKVLQTLDNNEYIISEKPLNFKEKNSKIVLEMFFSCFEEISKEQKLIPKDEKE
ncbi:MAG: sporulation protein YqfD [Bacilli bacterium]|nr:sporulation protein YqfD [Bacilli bacterium]MBO6194878.1 sporulation protein YqfD [Bacilli bacterium]